MKDVFNDLTKYLSHHLSLVGIFIASLVGLSVFTYDPYFQTLIVVSLAVAFVSWGTLNHFIHEDLNLKIFIEYLLVSIFGAGLILSVLLR